MPDMGDTFTSLGEQIESSLAPYVTTGVVVSILLVAAGIAMFAFATMTGSLCFFDVAVLVTWLSLFLMCIVLILVIILNTVIADICNGSIDDNLLDFVGNDETLGYYLTCKGTNPIEDPMGSLIGELCTVKLGVEGPACGPSATRFSWVALAPPDP